MITGIKRAQSIFSLELSLRKAQADVALIAGSRIPADQYFSIISKALASDPWNPDYLASLSRIGVAIPASHPDPISRRD
jgi:hypothetical protein